MRQKARKSAGLAAGVALILTMIWSGMSLWGTAAVVYGGTGTEVSMSAPDEVTPNTTFTATVDISQVENFDACNYNVSFDPTVLSLDSVTSGDISGTVIPVDIWNERSPGTVTIIQNVPGLSGVTGSGYLAVLRFQVIASQDVASQIILSNGILSNSLAVEIPATWTGVLVTGQGTPSVPASFVISDVSVTPQQVRPAEPVTISALVTNTGGSEGSYTVVLKVNGVEEAEKEVTLGARQIRTVSFTIVKSTASTYSVDVNGTLGEFTVTAPPTPPTVPDSGSEVDSDDVVDGSGDGTSDEEPSPPPPTPATESPAPPAPTESETSETGGAAETVTEEATAPSSPAPTESETAQAAETVAPLAPPTPSAPQPGGINWLVLGGTIGGIAVLGLIIFSLIVWRRSY